MAILLDASSNGAATGTSPLTWSHTCTGSNLILIVGFVVAASAATETVTAVTYNSIGMTQIGPAFNNSGASLNISLWYLLNPSTGANTISAAFSSILSVNGAALSLTGASAYDTTSTKALAAASISTNLSPTVAGAAVIDFIGEAASGTPSITNSGSQILVKTGANGAGEVWSLSMQIATAVGQVIPATYNLGGTGPDAAHRMASFTPVTFSNPSFKLNKLRPRAFAPGIAR